MEIQLSSRQTPGSSVLRTAAGWRLSIPAGLPRTYRLAQLDDYIDLSRKCFLHSPPWTMSLRARVTGTNLPGTWGFGVWNDPFGFSLGFGGHPRRLPALPQAAWFMHASPPNWLSLRDDPERIPANGFFAGTFCSPRIPSLLFASGLLALQLCAIRPISRFLRRLVVRIIHQSATRIDLDVTHWHDYSINWLVDGCTFCVDGNEIIRTSCSPPPPLGLVIWIDNQFAAWTPAGQLSSGTLENPAASLEIENLALR